MQVLLALTFKNGGLMKETIDKIKASLPTDKNRGAINCPVCHSVLKWGRAEDGRTYGVCEKNDCINWMDDK
jgi:hypothetical protein